MSDALNIPALLRRADKVAREPATTEIAGSRPERVYLYLVKYLCLHQRPPTFREIGKATEISSTSVVKYYLDRLAGVGLIELSDDGSTRGIYLVGATVRPPQEVPVHAH